MQSKRCDTTPLGGYQIGLLLGLHVACGRNFWDVRGQTLQPCDRDPQNVTSSGSTWGADARGVIASVTGVAPLGRE